MRIKCYCIGCSKHPLYQKRNKFKNWVVGHNIYIYKEEHLVQGKNVNCFEPESGFFDDGLGEPEDFEFEKVWYGDGSSLTELEQTGYTIYAYCGNEDYEGEKKYD